MNQVAEFLGLETFAFQTAHQLERGWDAGASDVSRLPQAYAAMDAGIRETLTQFFEPYNQQLYSLIDKDFGWT